ncbi:MAG: TasA family protein [Candidatus Velamenicoccus archaeovorus]
MAERDREKRGRKLLLTLLVVGVVGSLAGIGTFSAFSSTTSNDGNTFAAGTVYIHDNDLGAAMYNVTDAKPGDTTTACITVTYDGTLPAVVRLYSSAIAAPLAQYVDLTVEEGTGSPAFGDCTGFTPSGTVFSGTLDAMPNDFASGIATNGAANWTTGDSVDYRFTLTLQDDNNANGQAAGPLSVPAHSFYWEAQNA